MVTEGSRAGLALCALNTTREQHVPGGRLLFHLEQPNTVPFARPATPFPALRLGPMSPGGGLVPERVETLCGRPQHVHLLEQ